MEKKTTSLHAFCFLALTSCGTAAMKAPTSPVSAATFAVAAAKPPEPGFARFVYEWTRSDLEGTGIVPAQRSGEDAFLLNLFLKQDRSFILFYVEGQRAGSDDALSYDPRHGRKLVGAWSLDAAGRMHAGPLTCALVAVDGRDGVTCALRQPIVSADAVGRAVAMTAEARGKTPSDARFAEYR